MAHSQYTPPNPQPHSQKPGFSDNFSVSTEISMKKPGFSVLGDAPNPQPHSQKPGFSDSFSVSTEISVKKPGFSVLGEIIAPTTTTTIAYLTTVSPYLPLKCCQKHIDYW
ncbi:hypothetical protein [[Phormidium] sp. ETS-05]|uniref:hypothetical protein n=1 Tax=[Phormidium] sp. ETS-05 TaxID=222819 RepID=UPI0018EF3281|nr:hypothetical protein [[Phormidium] sp. ETS-05]